MKLLNYVGVDNVADIKEEAVDKILNVINRHREERSQSEAHDHLYWFQYSFLLLSAQSTRE